MGVDGAQGAAAVRLVVLCGLPGVGKTTLGRLVADALGATFLRIDAIEAAVAASGLDFGNAPVGYLVAQSVARDQLRAARPVVADAVNNVEIARVGWRELAAEFEVPLHFVVVTCSDIELHRRRVESREADLPGHTVPTWEQVMHREWEPMAQPYVDVDNVGDPAARAAEVLAGLRAPREPLSRGQLPIV